MTAEEAADLCGVSRQTIQAWYNEGLQRKPTQEQLIRFLANRTGYAAGSERERLARAQAEKFELENQRRRGELVLTDDVKQIVEALAADLNARHDGFAGRFSSEIPAITDAAIGRERLLDELRDVRSAFADAAEKLADTVRRGAGVLEEQPPEAEEEPRPVGRSGAKATGRKRRARAVEE